MKKLSQDEVKEIFQDFLNESGEWINFKSFIEDKGYSLEELGFEED